MYALESLIRVTAICLLAGAGWPSLQEQIRIRSEQALAQLPAFSAPSAVAQDPLPTVQMSQALAAQILAASSP